METIRRKSLISKLQLLIPLSSIVFTALFLFKIDANSVLVSDNQNKIIQAQAFVDSGFKSQYLSCKILEDLGGCKFFPSWRVHLENGISGPFPVAFSLFASIFGLLGDYSFLFYVSILFFWIGVFFLKFELNLKWASILFLGFGPAFFHSALFPDYSITFLITCVGLTFYACPVKTRPLGLLIGFFVGLGFFFRPENTTLYFLLGVFHLAEFIYKGRSEISTRDKDRLVLLIGTGIGVVFYGIANYYLYGSALGTRIEANVKIGWDTGFEKYSSLLFLGNGRVGFLFFCPWILLWLIYFFIRWKDLEKFERKLSLAVLISLFLGAYLAPNDSNIDWGTRYLSWLIVPAVVLFFSKKNSENMPRSVWILTGILFIVTLFFSKIYFLTQEKFSKEYVKYNEFLLESAPDIYVTMDPSISALFGQEILYKKVLRIRYLKDLPRLTRLLSQRNGSVSLVRYEPITSSFLQTLEKNDSAKLGTEIEEWFLRSGWKMGSKQTLEKIEILKFVRN
ncbi:LA_3751/LA_3752 family putative glycosyltransferase [Leptospira sp. SA-E8]|uniref:LA_3751/LA_3752 family putative glycosyltransferase n=1 Tax=Leptospira sp. SA-E8 TaxID=3422259 RepID=UPI003EBA43A6